MNWTFIARRILFGILWALWQAGPSVYVLDAWPSAFTWLKIGSASVVAFVGGCLTYARDPEAAFKGTPLAKAALLLALLLGLTACASDLSRLNTLTTADVRRAIEINTLGNDPEGLQCGQGLLAILEELEKQAKLPEPIGVVSAAAYARAVRIRHEDSTVMQRLNNACAPAFVESTYTYTRLLIKLGLMP